MAKKRGKVFTSILDNISVEIAGKEFIFKPELDYRVYREMVRRIKEADPEDDDLDRLFEDIASFMLNDKFRADFDEMLNDDEIIIPISVIQETWRYLLTEYKVLAEDSASPKA